MDKDTEDNVLEKLRDGYAVSYSGHTIEMDKYKYLVDGNIKFGKTCVGWYSLVDYIEG